MKKWMIAAGMLCLCSMPVYANEAGTALQVNGEVIEEEKIQEIENYLLENYEAYGLDTSDEEIQQHAREEAEEELIRETVVLQYAKAKGLDNLSEEEQQANEEAAEYIVGEIDSEWLSVYDEYIENGVPETTIQNIVSGLRESQGYSYDEILEKLNYYTVSLHIYQEVSADVSVSEEEITSCYEELIEQEEELYEGNIAFYEYAMNYGLDLMLYKPSGYRSVLQIILPVDDTLLEEYVQAEDDGTDTRQIEQEILDSVDDTVQEIYAAYENGESFESLVPIYTSDEDMLEHLEDGYSIHSDSILYPEKMVEAAFGEQMQAPGDISEAFVTEYGVHILYYLSDVESGPVELDDAVKEEVYDAVFQQKVEENYNSLVDGLVEDAEL